MPDVGQDFSGAPRWERWWIEIAVIPPVQPGNGVESIAVHAGFSGLGDFRCFHPVRFLKVAKVDVVLSVAALSLGSRGGGRDEFLKFGRGTCNHVRLGDQVAEARGLLW